MAWTPSGRGGGGPALEPRWRQEEQEEEQEAASWQAPGEARRGKGLFVLVSSCMVLALMLLPLWNCAVLLSSATYAHFVGRGAPGALLASCAAIFVGYAAVLQGFFSTARKQVQTAQALAMIGTAALTLLGLALMLCGHAVREAALAASSTVASNCHFGEASAPLARESQLLTALRGMPRCSGELSVEQCAGFVDSPEARVLRAVELGLRCSTFCHEPEAASGVPRPRTLFSRADYKASCQSMLARDLTHYVADVGYQTYYEGCMLVLTAVALAALKLVGACAPPRLGAKAPEGADYGATRRGCSSSGA